MIEIAKLEKMVQAELAADGWWHDLSKKEQQAYIKAHPGSKFAKSRKLAGGNVNAKKTAFHAAMTDSHSDAAAWHAKMYDKHSRLANQGKKRGSGVGDPHGKAAYLHSRAAVAHEKARVAHDDALHIDMGNATTRATHEARGASRVANRASKAALGDSPMTPKSKNYVGSNPDKLDRSTGSRIKFHTKQMQFHEAQEKKAKNPEAKAAHGNAAYAHRLALKAHSNDRPDAEKQSAAAKKASDKANGAASSSTSDLKQHKSESKRHAKLAAFHKKAGQKAYDAGDEDNASYHWQAAGLHRAADEDHDAAHYYGSRFSKGDKSSESNYKSYKKSAENRSKRADALSSMLSRK